MAHGRDANGTAVADCYEQDDAFSVSYVGLMVDEPPRIPVNIARLPELLDGSQVVLWRPR
jgi:hypothetical protein